MRFAWQLALVFVLAVNEAALAQSDASAAASATSADHSTPTSTSENPTTAIVDVQRDGSSARRITLEPYWDHGLWFISPDQELRLHIGGSAQIDSTWLIGPNGVFAIPSGGMNGEENASATFIRRARMRIDGDVVGRLGFCIEYDFANVVNDGSGSQQSSSNFTSSPAATNVWVEVRELAWLGNLRIGIQKKPIGLANNTGHNFLPFLERPDNHDAFYGPFDGGTALGAVSRNLAASQMATWQYGIYRPANNVFGVAFDQYAVGGRVTALPIYECDGETLLHFGMGTWSGKLPNDQLRVRARPVLRNGPGFATPVLVDTGSIDGDYQYTLAPELAVIAGPWTVQAEYACQFFTQATPANLPNQGTVFYHGGYVEALYFLTGEHDNYDKSRGALGRVLPNTNFEARRHGWNKGGAWQLGARFSYLDLNDKAINGGQVYDWTVGANWYLNPNMKFQFNYILEYREAPQDIVQGWINGIGLRAAFDF